MRDSDILRRLADSRTTRPEEREAILRALPMVEARERERREDDDTKPVGPVPDRGR